ncbi:efflux RND transporter permease subunit [Amphritea sp. 1_MG-2023]|uniref:efflux RND transporter permease subunit n=1 Tax=Amphritea sp. 1_MG-2023 TaxID=3062670 RepID=UPI0026E22D9D|nr:efflux RND transporter permease subunit [Amphritea sp. 1_MG-2023]MDO6562801.1 efflux RND transporter permease subunit [Amphritea sp. 1_MG-2023]
MSLADNSSAALRGPIAWMTHNRVTPNLMMLILLFGGLFTSWSIKEEVFPDFTLDQVDISVDYSGASPEEVEQGIVLAIEEAIRGVEGIAEITATASEGSASISAELSTDAEPMRVYQDIQQEVDAITTLPDDAEEPQISLASRQREVLGLAIAGPVSDWTLREVAETVRERLLLQADITQLDMRGDRDFEIQVEVDRDSLQRYNLTLADIATIIDNSTVELPGGSIETRGGEILLRVKQRRDWAKEFAQIPVVATSNGGYLTLDQIASVKDSFEDDDSSQKFNGDTSIVIEVYRVGDQTPAQVANATRAVVTEMTSELPPGVTLSIDHDMSEVYQQRLDLLLKNAFYGLVLVLVLLGLFLDFKLAFWVTLGIPTSFLGAFLFLPLVDVSLNMISMFAFIVALGIVVDDAIIAGENIYEHRQQGMGFLEAAIKGAREVSVPIAFSIMTNLVAFMPLYFVPGTMGKMFQVIPLVVAAVFLISWVEALLILPAHLGHSKSSYRNPVMRWLQQKQLGVAAGLNRFIEQRYRPLLILSLRNRYLTVALGVAVLSLVLGYAVSGRMGFTLMPLVESDRAIVTATLPYGSPYEKVQAVETELVAAIERVAHDVGREQLLESIDANIAENVSSIRLTLTDEGVRPLEAGEVTRRWRAEVGALPQLESLRFESDLGGPGRGAALTIELSHNDITQLDQASAALAQKLAELPLVTDIKDGFSAGKEQFDFTILPEGRSLGLTAEDVGRQVRNAFSGAEALRQQRGRNEIKVKVRLPEAQRISEYDIEQFKVKTPDGAWVPLMEVAQLKQGSAYTSIDRRNARRTVSVTANVDPVDQTNQVVASVRDQVMPALLQLYPGLSYSFQGKQADTSDSVNSLRNSALAALVIIYAMLAIPFRSYAQPILVMVAIPFGAVGALLGHLLMGFSLSVVSLMGIIALSGVVVNDSLVLIDYANRQRRAGMDALQAILAAGTRRFRPILLTTLTTFGGLAPMIFETSVQAKIMVPMAISLGYGILFATLISLLLVPSLYLILDDVTLRLSGKPKPLDGDAFEANKDIVV